MTFTEIIVLKLVDAATFNPMAILELLKQLVTTYSHYAGTTFKAYQEKQEYSKFYVIGGWATIEKRKDFMASELYTKLWQLLESTLLIESAELLELTSESITASKEPIMAVARRTVQDRSSFASLLQNHSGPKPNGGFKIDSDVYMTFTGLQSMKQTQEQQADELNAALQQMSLDCTVKHIEVNQFI